MMPPMAFPYQGPVFPATQSGLLSSINPRDAS
jgi:hypothetical protein